MDAAKRVNWPSVVLYYVIACAISWPFFWWRDHLPASWAAFTLLGVWKGVAPGFGPAIAALITMVVFRKSHPRTVSLFGSSVLRSLLFLITPIAVFTAFGVRQGEAATEVAFLVVAFIAYGFGEETGWRGFLWDALRPLPQGPRIILVAVLWGVWHFTSFLGGAPLDVLKMMALMTAVWIFGSWGLGKAIDHTKAITVAAVLHLAFNFARHLPGAIAWPSLGVCVVIWVLLLVTWPKQAEQPS